MILLYGIIRKKAMGEWNFPTADSGKLNSKRFKKRSKIWNKIEK